MEINVSTSQLELASRENFDEAAYLRGNPDVAEAVRRGVLSSGREHFDLFGRTESRKLMHEVNALIDPLSKPVPTEAVAAGEIRPHQELVQIFSAGADYLSCVSIRLATYKKTITSHLSLELFKLSGDLAGRQGMKAIGSQTISGTELIDNLYFDFYFAPDPNSRNEIFLLKLSSDDAELENSTTAWLNNGDDRIPGHIVCMMGGPTQGSFGIMARVGYSPPLPFTAVPERLLYSPVTQCNLNCVHCISRDSRKGLHRMTERVREEILAWCRAGIVKSIFTDYSGDILWADDRWGGELDFLIATGVPFHIDTNGTHLSAERGARLLNSRMEWLNVSVDAARAPTYSRIRKGSIPLQDIFSNVRRFNRLRASLEQRPMLSLGFTMMRSNMVELSELIEIGADIGVDLIACRHLEAYTPDMHEEVLGLHPEIFNDARLLAIEAAERHGIRLEIGEPLPIQRTGPGHRFCAEPWIGAVLLGNGDVQVCCLPKTKVGNLNESSLESIWHDSKYRSFRLRVNSDNPPGACKACGYARKPGNSESFLPYRTINNWVSPADDMFESNDREGLTKVIPVARSNS